MSQPPPDNQQWRVAHLTETYKGLITISVEALKILAIVNGGAAVAVLTYLGNLVSRSPPGNSPSPDVTPALSWYCGGLTATLLAFVCSYLTQLALFRETVQRKPNRYHPWFLWLAIVLAMGAVGAFFKGSITAADILAGPR
jgi:hypothetical protein